VSNDLGRVVSVHAKPWWGYGVGAVAFLALLVCADRLLGAISDIVFYVPVPVALAVLALRAKRTRVIVRERGFEWFHDDRCERVRWNEIARVEQPSALVVTLRDRAPLAISTQLVGFPELRDALANRRPTPATMPQARLHRTG
jgi:hypothetical protein